MKYLILLNRKFPYKSGETFLENEIYEICDKFDKILIYPSDITSNDSITRNIKSKNVETRIVEDKSLKQRKFIYLFNSIKYFFIKSDAKKIKEKLFEMYFLSSAEIQAKRIIKDLDKINFKKNDTIYLYSYWLYVNSKVACILKKYFQDKNIKVVAFSRAHGFDIYEEIHKIGYLPQRNEIMSILDHIYPCSNNGTSYLKNKFPKYDGKITTSYLGTYDHGISHYNNDNVFKIVSCSRLCDVKRVHLIIESLSLLKNSNISLSWTHLGGGDMYDEIKKLSDEKLSWMEVNLPGQMSNTDVYDYYSNNSKDLFVNVSLSEGLPVSIMETISFGIPVVATNVGGTSEIVIDHVNGFLLDKNFEPKELAELIQKIATMEKDNYIELRNNARNIWEEKYRATKNYESFSDSIMKL